MDYRKREGMLRTATLNKDYVSKITAPCNAYLFVVKVPVSPLYLHLLTTFHANEVAHRHIGGLIAVKPPYGSQFDMRLAQFKVAFKN